MVAVRVARELREARFDIEAAVEQPDMRGLADAAQLSRFAGDEHAHMSYDVADLIPLAVARVASGESHGGWVLVRSGRFPRAKPKRPSVGSARSWRALAALVRVV